ncbi:hypothetical protein Q3G72_008423 [Acer saccharum]|nr:hypothetical protein Q3G72_008423 [Acer saccharum]
MQILTRPRAAAAFFAVHSLQVVVISGGSSWSQVPLPHANNLLPQPPTGNLPAEVELPLSNPLLYCDFGGKCF